jgi:GH35 family endo-1,4-beta-xylanase
MRRIVSKLKFLRGLFRLSLLMLVALSLRAQNIVLNPGFESGAGNWFAWGSASISAATAQFHSGARAGWARNRVNAYDGIAQSVLGRVQTGASYRVSAWVRLESGASQRVQLTMQKVDGSGTSYEAVAVGAADSSGWTQLIGGYTLKPTGTVTALNLYVEGPPAGIGLYVDDVSAEAYDWKTRANGRIEQIRKRDVAVTLLDPQGRPLSGAAIEIRQTRNAFAFGSAINGNISNPKYAAFFRSNFEWAVLENESKWPANEPQRNSITYTEADRMVNFCRSNNIAMRGHCLFWEVDQYVQPWVKALPDTDLRAAMTNRIKSAMTHFKGVFSHWDVNNEMLHGGFYTNRLGAGIRPWMFAQAHAQDTNATLFVNDYEVVSGSRTEEYKQQIRALIASNAPVGGIGAQGHFGAVIDPVLTETRLDSLAELNLPIWITEYDSLNTNAAVRADNLEVLYRTAFSKKAVDGILMWGFWAGAHWRGAAAAIVNLDWTTNAAGLRYQALRAEWRTSTNGVSGSDGRYGFRGFHGEYEIIVTPTNGAPTTRRISVEPGEGPQPITLSIHESGARPYLNQAGRAPLADAIEFQLIGDAAKKVSIEASASLTTPNWLSVTNFTNSFGTIWFTNAIATGAGGRFYRATQN